MAKPNYQYDKRQRDIAKKKKQDEKRARKQSKPDNAEGEPATVSAGESADPGAAKP